VRPSGLWVALSAVVALVGCADPSAPSGFGVNVTVRTNKLDAATRASITAAVLNVTGDQNPYSKDLDIAKQLRGGEARFRYIPAVTSGSLQFEINLADASSATIANAVSDSVNIVDGKATPLLLDVSGLVDQPQGANCAANSQCAGGHCADGYCCDTACDGTCSACNVSGMEGTCQPVPAGMNPAAGHGDCSPQLAESCGNDGTCDGAGQCRKWPTTTQCKPPSCNASANIIIGASLCDGKGTCVSPMAQTCAPYVCQDATQCWSTCTADNSQCSAGNICMNSSCGLKANGANCSSAGDCQSNICVDGVCCDSVCGGPCQTCNQPSTLGTCTLVPKSQDPRGQCPASVPGCRAGGCDGSTNACLLAADGTVCQNGSCYYSYYMHQRTCSGGTCSAGGASGYCDPYTCYTSGTDSNCFSGCGTCNGSIYCLLVCSINGCPDPNSYCAPGHSCNTSSCSCGLSGCCGHYSCN
jgi:hypothetical protein